jgi:hypothetical protein
MGQGSDILLEGLEFIFQSLQARIPPSFENGEDLLLAVFGGKILGKNIQNSCGQNKILQRALLPLSDLKKPCDKFFGLVLGPGNLGKKGIDSVHFLG